ncbi:MAG TPA: glycosyltransferase [Puia sp.]|nr:glycosyltransferase [Puia sp.]
MHFAILTYGSRGDVQPYIALALGLIDRGHEARLIANENFAGLVESYGIKFHPLPGDMEALIRSPKVSTLLKSGNMISYLREMRKLMRGMQTVVNATMFDECSPADVEFLIASPLTMVWIYSIAERLGKNFAVVHLSLPAIPTGEFPFAGFPVLRWSVYNILTYKLMRFIYWRLSKVDIAVHRDTLRLPLIEKSVLDKIAEKKILNLHAISPALIPRPKDWDKFNVVTGFLKIPRTKLKSVTPGLETWLTQGQTDQPVYIGFGSIPVPDPELLAKIITELLATTKYRFILCEGWSAFEKLPFHERLLVVKEVDHEWLLPQCKCAVIHGGIGTIAATLRAKIPPIIVSIFADQPLWGRLISRKGLGLHIPFKNLTTAKLLAAIAAAESHKICQPVAFIGDRINKEDGLSTAIDMLESYFGNRAIMMKS